MSNQSEGAYRWTLCYWEVLGLYGQSVEYSIKNAWWSCVILLMGADQELNAEWWLYVRQHNETSYPRWIWLATMKGNKGYLMKANWFADTVFNVSQQWATNILDELFPEVVQIPSTINVISTMTTGLWQNKKKVSKPCYYRDTVQLRPQTVQ